MTKKRSNAQVQTDEITATRNDEMPPAIAIQTPEGGEEYFPAPAAKKKRSAKLQVPITLDPQFVHDPQRMQYALLLALLIRQKGTARFTAKDMEPVDTDYNILYARSIDGNFLEVTVVSSESGIIRSSEREKAADKWKQKDEEDARTSIYQPLPADASNPMPYFALHGIDPTMQQRGLTASPATIQTAQEAAAAQKAAAEATRVVSFPDPASPNPQTRTMQPADGSAAYQFPFQTGDRPETAGPLDLNALQKMLNQDRQVAAEEAAAIERMESGLE